MEKQVVDQPSMLPKKLQSHLDRFCSQLEKSMGDSLISVVLYGGLARGDEYNPRWSDVNVLVVLDRATVDRLDKIASPIRKAVRRFHLSPLVLSERDLRRSADVFPIKFLDMQRHHRQLWGRDLLTDLAIQTDHLRLRCEQELKNLLLRLRYVYLQRSNRPRLVEQTLITASSPFLHGVNALLVLKTGEAPRLIAATADAAERELGLDGETLRRVLAMKRGHRGPKGAELRQLFNSYMTTVEKAAYIADEISHG